MGILNNINTIREQLRKRQDKTLALKSKAARDEIRRQKFISKSRKELEEAKKRKKENSFLGRVSKKIQENKSKKPTFKPLGNQKKDSDKVRDAISIGGNRKKPYDPFNL